MTHLPSGTDKSIWVDADACPVVIRDIIVKAVRRTGIHCTFVANSPLPLPKLKQLRFYQVAKGYDEADNWIVAQVKPGDLVVTQDIPLADELLTAGACVLSPRGESYNKENIKSRLGMRDFMETLRSSGIQGGGSAPLSHQDRQLFANRLDQWLAQR